MHIAEFHGGFEAAFEHRALHLLSVFEHDHVACGSDGLCARTALHALHVHGAIVEDGAVGHFDLHAIVVRFEHLALERAAAFEHHIVVGILIGGGIGQNFALTGSGLRHRGGFGLGSCVHFGLCLDGRCGLAFGGSAHGGHSGLAALHTRHLFGAIHAHFGVGQKHFDGMSGHISDDAALGAHTVAQDDEIGQVAIGDDATHRATVGALGGGLRR